MIVSDQGLEPAEQVRQDKRVTGDQVREYQCCSDPNRCLDRSVVLGDHGIAVIMRSEFELTLDSNAMIATLV